MKQPAASTSTSNTPANFEIGARGDTPRKRLYLLHRWLGVVTAFVGALVFFSGAIATFHSELDAWSSRANRYPDVASLPGFNLDSAYLAARRGIESELLESTDIAQAAGHPVSFFFHRHEPDGMGTREVGVLVELDPESLEVLSRRAGDGDDVTRATRWYALGDFFIRLHLYLLMPETLGLILTGTVGFALILLISSGIWVHRPNLKRLVRRPRSERPRFLAADTHTLLGSWSLPYTLMVALTGAFFSFAGTVLVPAVAIVAFNGDQNALVETLVGHVAVSERSGTASLEAIRRDSLQRCPVCRFERVSLESWGKREASATVDLSSSSLTRHVERHLVYDGHDGAFLQEKPLLGTRPSLGNSVLALMADLHFGTLFGLLTKLLWAVSAVAACGLAASGLIVFTTRSKAPHSGGTLLVRTLTIVILGGLPLSSGSSVYAWFLGIGLQLDAPLGLMALAFGVAVLATAGLGLARWPLRKALGVALGSAGLLFSLSPWVALSITDLDLPQIWFDPALRPTLWVDGVLSGLGLALLLIAGRINRMPSNAVQCSPPAIGPAQVAAGD
ncbi:MAG TPA: PepSY-associated TM helix domain-containing protein [Polyangiaceae bacterium]|nr:PepSY-associated TM helix domain-containing protein [Polyangiaceae bacterium]